MTSRQRTLLALVVSGVLCACATMDPVPLENAERVRSSKPLGGQTLAEKHSELARTYSDLQRHLRTLDSLQLRGERNGLVLFREFLDEYLDDHVDPLLARDWTSNHPELAGLDAGIRFVSIELLSKVKDLRRAGTMIDDVRLRYRGREDVLVDYPVGKRTPLRSALEIVEEQEWRG